MQREITAPFGHDETAAYGRRPDDLVVDQSLDVFQNRVTVIARLGKCGVLVGAKDRWVRSVDAGESQFAQCIGDRMRVRTYVGRQRDARIARSLTNAFDARGGVALEDGSVLGERDLSGGVFRRLPIRVGRTALDIVDHLTIELEGGAQLDQHTGVAPPGDDALFESVDGLQMAG